VRDEGACAGGEQDVRVTSAVFDVLCVAIQAAADFVDDPLIAARWDDQSSLDGYTIGALAGHVANTDAATLLYLDVPASGEPVTRGRYYGAVPTPSEAPALHKDIRDRGTAIGEKGAHEVASMLRECASKLRARLGVRPSDDTVAVMGGHVMRLDDYLETRVLELAVHLDDLADSARKPEDCAPEDRVPEAAALMALDHLIAVAVSRHGATKVLRALTRAERDSGDVFPVL
jgi:hypothetical protein